MLARGTRIATLPMPCHMSGRNRSAAARSAGPRGVFVVPHHAPGGVKLRVWGGEARGFVSVPKLNITVASNQSLSLAGDGTRTARASLSHEFAPSSD